MLKLWLRRLLAVADPPRVLASLPAADTLAVGPGSLKGKSNRLQSQENSSTSEGTAAMQEAKETIQGIRSVAVCQSKDLLEPSQTSRLVMTPVKSKSQV